MQHLGKYDLKKKSPYFFFNHLLSMELQYLVILVYIPTNAGAILKDTMPGVGLQLFINPKQICNNNMWCKHFSKNLENDCGPVQILKYKQDMKMCKITTYNHFQKNRTAKSAKECNFYGSDARDEISNGLLCAY